MNMSFAWMRRIDRWIGIPLTRVLGAFTSRPRSLFGDTHPTKLPERVICAKFIGLGSVVLSLPLLKALKDAGVKVAFWSFPGQTELVRLSGLADEIWVVRPSLKSFLPSLWQSFKAARRFKADAFLDLEPTANFSAILAWMSQAAIRVGFMSAKPNRESLFTHLVALTPERHMVSNNLLMGELIGLGPVNDTELPPVPGITSVQARSHRRVVVNINASDLSWHRMWPEKNWVSLCQQLLKDPGIGELVFPGAAAEKGRVDQLIRKLIAQDASVEPRLVSLAGRTSLTQLLEVLGSADLVISVDSGIMHMAAWAGAPVVGLFGPETPSFYAPRSRRSAVLWASLPCSPCLTVAADKITRCQDNQCMKKITPKRVYKACQLLLADVPVRAA